MSDTTETITVDATSTTTDANPKPDAPAKDEPLGGKGLKALNDERDARKEAERRAKDAEDRLAAIDREKAETDEAEKTKAGQFETLANQRKEKLDELTPKLQTATEERDALTERVKGYEDRDRARLEAALKDLPDDLKGSDPIKYQPDIPLAARLAWLDDRTAEAAKRTTDPQRGNGPSPDKAGGGDPKADEKAREQFVAQNRREW